MPRCLSDKIKEKEITIMKKLIKNYLTKLQENDKKGFSLVELIIVMAIMAILVGVVASQVIPYMEKSRQSKDQQQLSEICTALVSAIAQSPVEVDNIAKTALGSVDNSIGMKAGTTTKTNIGDNLADLLSSGTTASDLTTIATNYGTKFKSSAYQADKTINISYSGGKTKVFVGSTEPSEGSKLIAISD
jgi:prepilin-type N-terminal cleavage/methylation domain-containing protein